MVKRTWLYCYFLLLALIHLQATETVLASAQMPNRIFPQSEIQLVETEDGFIVRSIIDTRFPDKVLKKIRGSEESNWGDNKDMQTYVETLEAAFIDYKDERRMNKQALLVVDFCRYSSGDRIDFKLNGELRESLFLSSNYIRNNQEYILRDAFGQTAETLIEQLNKEGHP
ncbi:MAG: hypothetical protein JW739_06470 [Opitutales bacterium]|nr:hypothetical protein [Opitutales bacterium]